MHKSALYSSLPVILLLLGTTECVAQAVEGTPPGDTPAMETGVDAPAPSPEGGGRRAYQLDIDRRLETIDPRAGDFERFRDEQRRRRESEFAARERETVERDTREREARDREARQRAAAQEQAIRGGR